jgi:predicted glycogen debranching enzyme
MIELDKSVCADLAQARTREWLETNGLGGFACSTIAGMNTRRYHGLLTAATKPPVGRVLLLSKLEETLVVDGRRVDLATNQYQGTIHPQGYQKLVEFRLDPFPTFLFEVEGLKIEKTVFMVHGGNTTVVEYRLLNPAPQQTVGLELRPLIAFRDYHNTTHENGGLNSTVEALPGLASVAPYPSLPRLYLAHNAARLDTQGYWYRQFFYEVEAERGLDAVEDLFNPLTLHFELGRNQAATVIASTEPQRVGDAGGFRRAEVSRRSRIAASVPAQDPLVEQLVLAADQFLVERGDGHTVIAGYPWFTDWGRDTMIAFPGLTLSTGNEDIAKGILREFSHSVDEGMLPNRFPDAGEQPEFNTVDATLWFFEAVRAYLTRTGDERFVCDELYGVLKDIIDWHMRGTRYNIRMLENGLLNAGAPGVQLTWMDAKVGDWVVTPRSGKPVEIQALWFNALKIMEDLATRFSDSENGKRCRTASSLVQWTFNRVFWNEEAGCLYDVVNGGRPDGSIRPNQIFAVSLHHTMLNAERAKQVLHVVERELLTPVGLRTLSRNDPNYKPRYEGDQYHRDSAYHQGTVWPWLLGPFISAYLKVHGNAQATRERARELLRPMEAHLKEGAVGQVSEIFDADAPRLPRGCFAQAWSVGEILRVLCDEIYQQSVQRDLGIALASD